MFFSGLSWFFLVLGNASFFLELRFARVSAQEEPLAPRSDQNKFFGIFLNVFGHFSFVPRACVRVCAGVCASVRAGVRLGSARATQRRC